MVPVCMQIIRNCPGRGHVDHGLKEIGKGTRDRIRMKRLPSLMEGRNAGKEVRGGTFTWELMKSVR